MPMELSLPFAVGWLTLLAALCLLVWSGPVRRRLARCRHSLVLALPAAALARLVPSLFALPPDALVRFDHDSYRLVADAVAAHRDVYALAAPGQPPRYPYLPLHLYLFAGAGWVAAHTGLPFLLLAKAPAIAADAALAGLVAGGARALGRASEAPALALVCALNPLAVLVTAYHGQFDAVSTAAVLAAWLLLHPGPGCQGRGPRRSWRALVLSALLLGLAIADKTWPAILLPLLMLMVRGPRARATLARRAVYLAIVAAPVTTALALYAVLVPGGAAHALRTVRAYHGVDTWGISALVTAFTSPAPAATAPPPLDAAAPWLTLAGVAAGNLIALRLPPGPERPAVVIAAAYATAVSWGWNWLVWLMPFALLARGRWGPAYLAAATVYVALVYLGFGGVLWGFVELTGTFGPLAPFRWAKLALWGAFVLGVAAAAVRVRAGRTEVPRDGGVARRPAGG
jgi:hypothetical protein